MILLNKCRLNTFLTLVLAFGMVAASNARAADFLDAVEQIVGADAQLKSQGEQTAAADQRASSSSQRYLPQLNAVVDQNIDKHSLYAPGASSDTYEHSAGINATLNIFRSGGDLAQVAVLRHTADAQRAAQSVARLDVEKSAAYLLIDLIAAQQRVHSLEIMSEAAHVTSDNAQRLFLASRINRQDQQRQKVVEMNLLARLAVYTDQAKVVAARLKARMADASVATQWPFAEAFSNATALEHKLALLGGAGNDANHPRIVQADAEVARVDGQIGTVKAKIGPSIDASFTRKKIQNYQLHHGDDYETQALFTLTIPIASPDAPWSEVSALQHERLAAQDRAEDRRRQLLEERVAASQGVIGEAHHIGAQQQAVKAAGELLEESRRLFALGQIPSLDLASDEQRAFEAELLLIERWRNAHISMIDYCGSIGMSLSECFKAVNN